ncbi:MAG: hypothetical protein ABIV25_01225 [Paracoccaceae bacterium]
MAKEWEKFQKDYAKLASSIKTYSFIEAQAYSKRLSTAWATCSQGEENLADSMVTARKNGVAGTGLADFTKDKSFKEALGLLDKATSMLTEEIRAFENFCLKAGDAVVEVAKLTNAIEKDLKGRKDKSESKKEIEGLLVKADADRKDMLKASKYYTEKVTPAALGYAKNFQKTVGKVLAQAPADQDKRKDATELPQLFVDRNLNKNFKHAVSVEKQIRELCNAAIEKAADDMKAAAGILKTAAPLLMELKSLRDSYTKAAKDHSSALDVSKDKAKIEKMVDVIIKSYEKAEPVFRGTATTMKKAA